MPAHPIWKGYLRLSLVTCAIALYPATTQTTKVHFHKLNARTGNRLRMRMIDEVTGDEVPSDAQTRGYEFAKGESVVLEPEELDDLALDSTRTIDIAKFVSRDEIDPLYFDKAYFVGPRDEPSRDAFEVIRHAMARRKVAALSSIVLHDREHVLLLEARDAAMTATMLHWPYEMRDPADILGHSNATAIDDELLDVAETLIDRKRGHFDPSEFTDRYEEALQRLVEAKRAGRKAARPKPPQLTGAKSLMEALKASLGDGVKPPARKRPSGARPAPPRSSKRRKPSGKASKSTA